MKQQYTIIIKHQYYAKPFAAIAKMAASHAATEGAHVGYLNNTRIETLNKTRYAKV